MSVRMGLLAVVAEGDLYTYEIKKRFEERTAGAWPIDLSQVASTLHRLAAKGLVAEVDGPTSEPMHRDVRRFTLTEQGAAELAAWWLRGVDRATPARDELSVKIALALSDPDVDTSAVLQVQRKAMLRDLQDLTRLRRHHDLDPLWELTLERMLAVTEAELRWLEEVAVRAPALARRTPSERAYRPSGTRATGANT